MANVKPKEYRVTWRHEVIFTAHSDEEARDLWGDLDLGHLDTAVGPGRNEPVETCSFECVTDDHRDVPTRN